MFVDNLPTDPSQWVAAFKEMSTISKTAFWVFVGAVSLKIGGDGLARVLRALRGK